jgi:ribose 1,5-bisphosphokinase
MATSDEGVLMAGRLIYLIGPSGSGKDSLLDAARARLAERGCRIVRRVITRSAEASRRGGARRQHAQQFRRIASSGRVCPELACQWSVLWHPAGNRRLAGRGSRRAGQWLARASAERSRALSADLLVVLLTVDQAVLRERLLARGRESVAEIDARLARNARFNKRVLRRQRPTLLVLDNSGALENTVSACCSCIDEQSHAPDPVGHR